MDSETNLSDTDSRDVWVQALHSVISKQDLDESQASELMGAVLDGKVSEANIAGLLVALSSKGESVSEISGFAKAMMQAAEPISVPDEAIDIVGTGGSTHGRSYALNLSTMASFVVAAAGGVVCKHGNRKASSTSGSFDFLEALGINIDLSPAEVQECVAKYNLGFVYAKSFHPAMRYVGPVRRELGVPTVFNILGPLAHPGNLKRFVLGTPLLDNANKLAKVLQSRGVEKAWVVCGDDGLDELTTTGRTQILEVSSKEINQFVVKPGDIGISQISNIEEIKGGSPETNVKIFKSIIIDNENNAYRDILLLNSAAGLVVADKVDNLRDGAKLANTAISNGSVAELVENLTSITNGHSHESGNPVQ